MGLLGLSSACTAPSVPKPESAGPGPERSLEVAHPPPAALPEIVPPEPAGGAVWLDGHWVWRGQNWVWERGGWVRPAKGSEVSPWRVAYQADGKLVFIDSLWLDERGQPLEAPAIVLPAQSPATPRLSEDATTP